MIKMDFKRLLIAGFIVGIAFFFIGAIILNVFPSDESNLLSYRVSAIIKLIGIGILTSSMVVGGVIIKDIDKNQKTLLLVIGLILLIIYTIGSPALQWDVDTSDSDSEAYDERPTAYGTPGFEIIYTIIAISIIFYLRKRKNH